MSTKKHTRARLDNALTDLVAAVRVSSATGGSMLSSYGTLAYATNYALLTLQRIILTYLFANNGIFQTAIQLPIQDALSKGIEIESSECSSDDIDTVMDWIEDNNILQKLENFWCWVRNYGGGGLVVNTNQDPESPLNLRALEGAPIELYDLDRWQISTVAGSSDIYGDLEDIFSADNLYVNGQKIHPTRIILGTGKRAPSYIRRQLRGWGMSEGERMIRDLNNYLKTQDVLYEILDESKIDIYHVKNLANLLLTAGGTANVQKRIQAANELKSYVNALILDSEETFEQKTMAFSGLAEVMKENRIGVASALRMPMTKLFGLSASGFSTGESDEDNYNQMVESEIRTKMRPQIRKLLEIGFACNFGYVPTFRFKFPPLKTLPQLDAEQIKASQFNRYMMLYDRGLIEAPQVGESLAKEEAISSELGESISQMTARPVPPNGPESVMPVSTEQNTITVYKNAKAKK